MMYEAKFIQALHNDSICEIQRIPKSDLHSHAGRGGSITYIEQLVNVKITPPSEPFNSLKDMNQWLNDNVKCHCPGFSGYLELDQIQHGIAAADSPQIMKWLAKHKIQLNLCPTSNVMLKNTEDYQSHQIRKLYDYGVPVTINSDDLIIFNASVSQEYLNLYNAGLMTAEELNTIRGIGLASTNGYSHSTKGD